MTPARRALAVLLAVVFVAISAGRAWALSLLMLGAAFVWSSWQRHAPLRLARGPRDFPAEARRIMYQRDGGQCRYCLRGVHFEMACPAGGCDDDFEADHVVAWSKGGPTTLENGVTACRRCNRAKSDRPVEEFLRELEVDGLPGMAAG